MCKFTEVSLDDLPSSYTAISYCWGDPSPSDTIWIGEDRYLEINTSASEILRVIAAEKTDRYYWIDAICIDQKDLEDKNRQVPLMGKVYASAEKVIAWLGPAANNSDDAIEFIDHLHNTLTEMRQQDPAPKIQSLPDRPGCGHPSASWIALAHLLERPWFQRMWIIQEVILAADVSILCGDKMLTWDRLSNLITRLSGRGLDVLMSLALDDGTFWIA